MGRQADANAFVPLPVRGGVAPSYLWLTETRAGGMLRFLAERFPDVTRDSWAARLQRGEVVDAVGTPLTADSHVRAGMRIWYYRELDEQETPIPFKEQILFQDAHLLIVDKPHFLPMIPTGRFLHETLDAIRAQTHPAVETIVVDDASTDSETVAVMEELERAEDVKALRLSENGGPSRARNAALELCRGRYVLPVDADNLLLPDAIDLLVTQLKGAGEDVGYIYPNLQYFGNREDYFEAPDWDLYELLQRNYCDVCGLFDRDVFDAGVRFDF